MRRPAVGACVLAAAALAAGAAGAGSAPPGATARCVDGTYSFSAHHSGSCSHHHGVAQWLDGRARATRHGTLGRTILLTRRTRTQGCRLAQLPDRRCSPGAYVSGLTTAMLCSPGFHTSTIRDVPQSEKRAVESEYGLAPKAYGRTLEIDHIVPLELGGSNDIANLYPERDYHPKDELENRLHTLVCSGAMQLRAAQRAIARNWRALYTRVVVAR